MLKSLEQERAKYAWECIMEIKEEKNEELEKKYKSYIKKAPTFIQNSGLGNTLAFYKSKANSKASPQKSKNSEKKAYRKIYNHINEWFKMRFEEEDILKWICKKETSSIEIFRVTKELILLLDWMKKFVEAELKGEE